MNRFTIMINQKRANRTIKIYLGIEDFITDTILFCFDSHLG